MSEPAALEASLHLSLGEGAARFTLAAELALARGVLVLFGPSGAGKSVTLQAIVGLLEPERGSLVVRGETLFDRARGIVVPPERRRIGYVPQHHALFPFLDVAGNVAFGLGRAARRNAAEATAPLLRELGLEALAHARPDSLSGGERQRVALARALAVQPRLLVLDEPFASIDHEGRRALRRMVRDVLDRRGTPAVFVTHDPAEAIAMGDALVKFERGRTTVSGTPSALLGEGEVVTLVGRVASAPEACDDGRARATLRDAVVEGPAQLVPEAGREIALTLRLPPR